MTGWREAVQTRSTTAVSGPRCLRRRLPSPEQRTDQLQAGFDLILAANAFAVLLDGMDGDQQVLGDLPVARPLEQQGQDVVLPLGERPRARMET